MFQYLEPYADILFAPAGDDRLYTNETSSGEYAGTRTRTEARTGARTEAGTEAGAVNEDECFTWEHVLRGIQANADALTRANSTLLSVSSVRPVPSPHI